MQATTELGTSAELRREYVREFRRIAIVVGLNGVWRIVEMAKSQWRDDPAPDDKLAA